jgi:hypothetical protein
LVEIAIIFFSDCFFFRAIACIGHDSFCVVSSDQLLSMLVVPKAIFFCCLLQSVLKAMDSYSFDLEIPLNCSKWKCTKCTKPIVHKKLAFTNTYTILRYCLEYLTSLLQDLNLSLPMSFLVFQILLMSSMFLLCHWLLPVLLFFFS